MDKKYSVKDIEVLYYDNKVIPVTHLNTKKGKKILFLLNNAKIDVETEILGVSTYNKGANNILTLRTANDTKRYAEIGTLTSAIINYGKTGRTQFPKLFSVKRLVDTQNPVDNAQYSQIAKEYFNTELSVEEIKDLFKELQKGYDVNKYDCPKAGRE